VDTHHSHLNKLTQAFLRVDSEIDAIDIADIIWLASKLGKQKQQNSEKNIDKSIDKHSNSAEVSQKENKEIEQEVSKTELSDQTQIDNNKVSDFPLNTNNTNKKGNHQSIPIRVPTTKALHHPLRITRALRPLHRKTPSHKRYELDVNKTVDFIAEQEIYYPVTRGVEERWLDLEVIVDISDSMLPWSQTISEFRTLINYSGIFRNIRYWYLPSENNTNKLYSDKKAEYSFRCFSR